MRELIEEYSLLFAIAICSICVIIWNIGAHIYFKYFDSDKKRIDRINRDHN